MNPLSSLFLRALAVFIAAYLVPGVAVGTGLSGLTTALIVAVVLGLLNHFLRPLLLLLTLPINLLTLGLFTLVINVALIFLTAYLVPGFSVAGFLPAFFFGLIAALTNSFLASLSR